MSRHPNPLAETQFERNGVTRGDWESFASHRRHVTELIIGQAAPQHQSLCVLGAGNGNDLDLTALGKRFAQISLVDLDRMALDHCAQSQLAAGDHRVETIGGVDLSGLLDLLGSVPDDIDLAIKRASRPPISGLGTYDVVVSTCLLTQMIDSVVTALGADHPRTGELVLAVRDGHLRLLDDLTAGGGTSLLITDFVSSDTLPELGRVPLEHLEPLLARAINERNFFSGVNPAVLVRQFGSIGGGGSSRLHRPWRWPMGNRAYGVCAVSRQKPDS